jgi:uncharacterized protein
MPTLKDRLQADLASAMRARDTTRTATLRMVLTAVTTAEVAGRAARELSDDEVLAVMTKEAKKRRESIEAFEQAGRTELADRERAEADVLAEYLPTPLTPEELSALVATAITETGAEGPRGMGQVMKALQPRIAGRADGAVVAAEVRRQLGT